MRVVLLRCICEGSGRAGNDRDDGHSRSGTEAQRDSSQSAREWGRDAARVVPAGRLLAYTATLRTF